MKAKTIVKNFGFEVEEDPISIYPFAPVYRMKRPEGDFIVKKTQHPLKKANRLMNYTRMLKERGVDVVTPAKIQPENPRTINEGTYVVYPFIQGAPYTGQDWEIVEAGRLLGRIHALSPADNEYALDIYNVFDFTEVEVKESFQRIEQNAAAYGITMNLKLEDRLLQAVRQQEKLKQAGLFFVATPHDFKANNLVYTPQPYLIDPDNAGWVPRIFDLALVLLLFHNELASAPDRMFTKKQWHLFLTGYGEFVNLSHEEKANWPKAMEHVFLDEVMWLMADVEEDWYNPAQRNLFNSLIQLFLNFEEYNLT